MKSTMLMTKRYRVDSVDHDVASGIAAARSAMTARRDKDAVQRRLVRVNGGVFQRCIE
jgi:hypothetical protein